MQPDLPGRTFMPEHHFVVSAHPHVHSGRTLQHLMLDTIVALIPATLFGLHIFGLEALRIMVLAVGSALVWETAFAMVTRKPLSIRDGTGVAGALLLAMLLPATLPWWIVLIGTLLMIVLGKEVFGGYGSAPFNGVLIAWVVLHISYPDFMYDWGLAANDPAAAAAPMEVFKHQGPARVKELYSLGHLLVGPTTGSIGQSSMLMLCIGGLYLFVRRVIDWRIPFCFLAGVFAFSALIWAINPAAHASPVFHLLAGGSIIAAFFLATDMPSTPVTRKGMIIFGLGAGVLTVIIRIWGAWAFGAFFALLIMSMATPFLDKLAPQAYGR